MPDIGSNETKAGVRYAAIAPHSGTLCSGPPHSLPGTRAALAQMKKQMEDAQPDIVAVITPHGYSIEGKYSLCFAERAMGRVEGGSADCAVAQEFSLVWAQIASEHEVPIAPITSEGPFPLDWGVVIPAVMLLRDLKSLSLAVACPSVSISRSNLIRFGEALQSAAVETGQRVALIISADQGHGHSQTGPYGASPESATYDQAMQEAIANNRLSDLLDWDDNWLEAAKVDSYWQTLTLLGVQSSAPLVPELLSYEIDDYFGLICASWTLPA